MYHRDRKRGNTCTKPEESNKGKGKNKAVFVVLTDQYVRPLPTRADARDFRLHSNHKV